MSRGWYQRVFARCYDAFQSGYEREIASRRRELLAGAKDVVLEIGPGTGANLPFLPAGCRWIGLEPNPHMHPPLRRRAARCGIRADLRLACADGIDVDDAAADVALSTLVLCSVPQVRRTLSEIRRVLRPGGHFLFMEHVAAPRGTALRKVQRLLRPAWYVFGDGCHVDREIGDAIRDAGFTSVAIERFHAPAGVPWVKPHIIGRAIR